jgi:hypothetical protein
MLTQTETPGSLEFCVKLRLCPADQQLGIDMATPEERRERWEKSVTHKIAHGLKMETDSEFLGWIEQWIAGDLSIKEVQERYATLLLSRDKTGVASNDFALTLLTKELPELGGAHIRRSVERSKTTRAVDAAWNIDDQY